MQTLDWAIRQAVQNFGGREAVVDGKTRLSYREFGERCDRLGQALLDLGIKPGDRVATLISNSHRYLEMHFAIPGIGAAIVPINSRLAPAEMQYILEDSGSRVLITDEAHAPLQDALRGCVERIIVAPTEYEDLLAAAEPAPLPGPETEDSLAGLYYTGGTTGPGKGVMLTHRSHIANCLNLLASDSVGNDCRFMYVFPLFHIGAIASVYGLIWRGAKHVFVPVVDPELLLATIEAEKITHTAMVPAVINFLVNHPKIATTDLSSLQRIGHGAAPIAPDLCRRAVEAFGCGFQQAYGMTEACGVATLLSDEQDWIDHERIRSAGQPAVGVEVVIRRPDGTPCKPRETGEVTLRGPNILKAYWNKPEQTAEVLRNGWYWSGDIGYADEGNYIYIVDRAKDMIVTGGENVYSVEVESAISSHPAVLEVGVVGIPDEKWGEAVHAIVYLRPGESATEVDIIEHCRQSIAGYKCPKSVSFSDAELPKSAVGKLLKRDLRAPYWEEAERGVS